MSKDSEPDIINRTKKGFKKKFLKVIKIFLEKRKTKSKNTVANDIKVFKKMINKG